MASVILLAVVAADKSGQASAKIAMISVGVLFSLCVLEFVYRVWVFNRMSAEKYRICSEVYAEFDEKHGQRFKPNRELWHTFVENGRVVFGTTVSRSNADALGGRTTIAEYAERDIKVLVFGDSFSHWNQNGVSWPDILEEELARRTGRSVGVLNFARGGYGVIQMLTLAAEKTEQHKPNLVIIAAIGEDFIRGRWWSKEIDWQGYTRSIMTSRKDMFLDYQGAADTILVKKEADRQWCERMLAGEPRDDDQAVLDAANRQLAILRNENFRVRNLNPFSLSKSYVYSHLILEKGPSLSSIPRVAFDDFSADEQLVSSIESLHDNDCPLLLVYLPKKIEIDQAKTVISVQAERLMQSLERLTHESFVQLHKESELAAPDKMDLKPYDAHPNFDGINWYARAVAPFAERLLNERITGESLNSN